MLMEGQEAEICKNNRSHCCICGAPQLVGSTVYGPLRRPSSPSSEYPSCPQIQASSFFRTMFAASLARINGAAEVLCRTKGFGAGVVDAAVH
jgi:hypothetical protein